MSGKTLILILAAFLQATAWADSAPSLAPSPSPLPKPHRIWVNKGQRNVRVNVDRVKQGVDVTMRKDEKNELPRSVGITLTDTSGKQTSLELQAISPEPPEGRYHGDLSGSLSGSGQSIMGFELRIPLGSGPPKVLKSEEMEEVNP